MLKKINIKNINIDLMYALPNETINELKKDIEYISKLDITHISTYSLIIENNTLLKIKNEKNVSEDLDYEMYKIICSKLNKESYNHYEISNFAKKGYESSHNTCYWNNDEYYGFGLGASSYINNLRIINTRSITNYLKNNYNRQIESLTYKDKIEYEIILNLRKKMGIDLLNFKNRYKKNLNEIYNYNELINKNLLKLKQNHLFIPEDKWYISNEIIVMLLGSEKQ